MIFQVNRPPWTSGLLRTKWGVTWPGRFPSTKMGRRRQADWRLGSMLGIGFVGSHDLIIG